MADTDVIGIVSLLLAAGGAAYLFRSRIIGHRAEKAEAEAAEAEEAEAEEAAAPETPPPPATKDVPSAARDAETLPPRLRPTADGLPGAAAKASKATVPQTPTAKSETKDTQVSRKDPEPIAKAEKKPPESVKKPAADNPNAAKEAVKESKMTPVPVTVPEKKSAKKQTMVGLPDPAVLTVPKIAMLSKPADISHVDVPRINVEEDEDVEPTRVGRYDRQSIRPPVERLVFDVGADEKAKGEPLSLFVFALAHTDPGKRRKQNEDSFLVRDSHGLYVVADGMGGHRGGEIASKLAVDTISNAFDTQKFEAEAHVDLPPAASELARAIQMANSAILTEASQKAELKGMGTTLCAARFTEDNRRLFLGHVGDSRCYRVRDGVMKQMTNDHTMADYGVAGPEGAHLSRALGVWPTVPIDIIMATPELGDVYLLCSDGLTKMLTDQTIATQLLHEDDPKAAVERLVFFANAHGGKDNITVILLRVVEPGWQPPSKRQPDTSA